MKINITTRDLELTDEVSEYVDKRLELVKKVLPGHKDGSAQCDVVLVRETEHHQTGEIYTAEMRLKSGPLDAFVKASESTILAAIDVAKDDLLRSMKNTRNKKATLWKKGAQRIKKMMRYLKF